MAETKTHESAMAPCCRIGPHTLTQLNRLEHGNETGIQDKALLVGLSIIEANLTRGEGLPVATIHFGGVAESSLDAICTKLNLDRNFVADRAMQIGIASIEKLEALLDRT